MWNPKPTHCSNGNSSAHGVRRTSGCDSDRAIWERSASPPRVVTARCRALRRDSWESERAEQTPVSHAPDDASSSRAYELPNREKTSTDGSPGTSARQASEQLLGVPRRQGDASRGTARQRHTQTQAAAAAGGGAAGPPRTVLPAWEAGGRLDTLAGAPAPRGSARGEAALTHKPAQNGHWRPARSSSPAGGWTLLGSDGRTFPSRCRAWDRARIGGSLLQESVSVTASKKRNDQDRDRHPPWPGGSARRGTRDASYVLRADCGDGPKTGCACQMLGKRMG